MKKFMPLSVLSTATIVIALLLVLIGISANAAWRSQSWTYQAADLSDSNCVQVAIDEFDARLDAMGAASSTAGANSITGTALRVKSGSSTYGVALGQTAEMRMTQTNRVGSDCWSSYTNYFSPAFVTAPVFFYRYTVAGYAQTSSVSVTATNFVLNCSTNFEWMAFGKIQ